jgi:hypothetical protein
MTVVGIGPASGPARKIAAEGFAEVFGFDTREEVAAWLRTRRPGVVLLKGGKILPLNPIADADDAVHVDIGQLAREQQPAAHELP